MVIESNLHILKFTQYLKCFIIFDHCVLLNLYHSEIFKELKVGLKVEIISKDLPSSIARTGTISNTDSDWSESII
jgi:hypothetical protein